MHSMMTRYYKVAGHTFTVSSKSEIFEKMDNFEPFECEGGEPLFSLTIEYGVAPEYTEVYRQEHWLFRSFGYDASGNEVYKTGKMQKGGYLICSKDHHRGCIIMMGDLSKMVLDYTTMLMYSMAAAEKDTLLLHAVVVSCEGKGYLFLGPSHMGKSTHAQLWLEHIEGTELVNDDFPVVRVGMVYGSPWGWKTPCYRNVSFPIGGMVILSQAPYNKVQRLSGVEAYMYLNVRVISNLSDRRIAECLHPAKNKLASTVPMWFLECLPDEEAARLCHDTITNQEL